MSFENAESIADELKLYTENEGDIYRSTTEPIIKNLMRKRGQGKYDRDLAAQAFMYLAEAGARKYAREFDRDEGRWHAIFPIEVRRQVAAEWRDEFEKLADAGEYDSLLPKKYQHQPEKRSSKNSTAYASGEKDASDWIRKVRPLESSIKNSIALSRNLIQVYGKNNSDIARRLGISTRSVEQRNNQYKNAASEYDEGFLSVCKKALKNEQPLDKTKTRAPKSPTYLAGYRDGNDWVHRADPRRDTLAAYVRNDPGMRMPHDELVRENKPSTVAKKLGVTVSDVKKKTKAFELACEQYSGGYYDACQNILNAMDGN